MAVKRVAGAVSSKPMKESERWAGSRRSRTVCWRWTMAWRGLLLEAAVGSMVSRRVVSCCIWVVRLLMLFCMGAVAVAMNVLVSLVMVSWRASRSCLVAAVEARLARSVFVELTGVKCVEL